MIVMLVMLAMPERFVALGGFVLIPVFVAVALFVAVAVFVGPLVCRRTHPPSAASQR